MEIKKRYWFHKIMININLSFWVCWNARSMCIANSIVSSFFALFFLYRYETIFTFNHIKFNLSFAQFSLLTSLISLKLAKNSNENQKKKKIFFFSNQWVKWDTLFIVVWDYFLLSFCFYHQRKEKLAYTQSLIEMNNLKRNKKENSIKLTKPSNLIK